MLRGWLTKTFSRLSESESLASSSSDLYSKRLSKWCLCLGSTLLTALLVSRPLHIFSSMSAIFSILLQLYGCFQEFLVGVKEVAFSRPQGSFIGFLSSLLFRHTCTHVFFIFFSSCQFADLHTPFVISLIDIVIFKVNIGRCLRFRSLYFWLFFIFRLGIFRFGIFILAGRSVFRRCTVFSCLLRSYLRRNILPHVAQVWMLAIWIVYLLFPSRFAFKWWKV